MWGGKNANRRSPSIRTECFCCAPLDCGSRTIGISGIYAPGQLYPAPIKNNKNKTGLPVYRTDTWACFHNKLGVRARYFCFPPESSSSSSFFLLPFSSHSTYGNGNRELICPDARSHQSLHTPPLFVSLLFSRPGRSTLNAQPSPRQQFAPCPGSEGRISALALRTRISLAKSNYA